MRKKIIIIVSAIVILLLIFAELFARFYLGLGTPPVYITHPTIEYLLKPDQDVNRFGNRVLVNHYGMRSENFPVKKSNAEEIRVIVFGDSIINGGSLTQQNELATTILQLDWQHQSNRPVIVANVSAGSWGPGNWLAYANEYGFFDADIAVLVMSSDDAFDAPTFEPLNPDTHPQHSPFSALVEGIDRYLPRYLPHWSVANTGASRVITAKETKINKCLEDLHEFLILAEKKTGRVIVFLHPTKDETDTGQMEDGYKEIAELLERDKIPFISMQPSFHKETNSQMLYRDNDKIHPNSAGQKLIANIIENNIPKAWFIPVERPNP